MPALVALHGAAGRRTRRRLGGELRVALDCRHDAARDQLRRTRQDATPSSRRRVAAGILVNVESTREIERARRDVARRCGVPARVAVRVNPDFELKSSGMKMGGGPKQFGVDAEQRAGAARARSAALGLALRGLPHLQRLAEPARGGDLRSAAQDRRARAAARRATRRRRCECSTSAAASASPTSPASSRSTSRRSATNLAATASSARGARCRSATLVIELGRYLVGEAGIYVCRVIDRKVSRGQVFLVTDGGLHHHLAASGNFGQVIRKNYPVVIGNRVQRRARARSPRSSGRCARRSTCSPTGWISPKRSRATSSSCSSRAPTARPRARPRS